MKMTERTITLDRIATAESKANFKTFISSFNYNFTPQQPSNESEFLATSETQASEPSDHVDYNGNSESESNTNFDAVQTWDCDPCQYLITSQGKETPKLLFRFFDEHSGGVNNPTRFLAGRTMAMPKLKCFLNLSAVHLEEGRTGSIIRTASPFISISSSLIWVMEMALRRSKNAMIAVFRPDSVGSPLYAVKPILQRLRAVHRIKFYGYQGAFEYFAWQQAKPIFCFKPQDLLHLCDTSIGVRNLLRPTVLIRSCGLKRKLKMLVERKIHCNIRVAITKILHSIGATSKGRQFCLDLGEVIVKDWYVTSRGIHWTKLRTLRQELWELFTDRVLTDALKPHHSFLGVYVPLDAGPENEILSISDTQTESTGFEMLEAPYPARLPTPDVTPQGYVLVETSREEESLYSTKQELCWESNNVGPTDTNAANVSNNRDAFHAVNVLVPKFLHSPYTPRIL